MGGVGVVHELPTRSREASAQSDEVLTLDELTRKHILWVLDKNNGAKDKTAKMLGIDRKTLYRKLNEYDASSSVRSLRPSV